MRKPFFLELIVLTSLVLAAGLVWAQAPARDHDIVPEDYFDIIGLGSLTVSPDGKFMAFTESRWGDGKDGRVRDLWVMDKDGKNRRRLTFDNFGPGSLTWSADSREIWFTGRDRAGRDTPPHDGSPQVWRLSINGGTPSAVTRIEDGIGMFQLSTDGSSLYYTISEEVKDAPWLDMKKKYADLEYGHGVSDLDAIHRLDLVNWRDEEILPAKQVIWEMQLAPNGQSLALITTDDNELIFKEGWSRVEILTLADGQLENVTPQSWRSNHKSPYGWLENITWAGDSRAVAFSIGYDGYASQIWVADQTPENWQLNRIDRPELVTFDGGLQWRGQDRNLCYRGETMGRIRVYETQKIKDGEQGRTRVLADGDIVTGSFDFDRKGKKLFATLETTTHLNDIFAVRGPEKMTRLTNVNPQVDTWKLPQIQHVSWTGADGDTCYGLLELPPSYQPGDGPLPTIIELHGGPTSSTKYRLRLWIYGRALMASKGYALLSPNYHGSTGYGDDFLEKLIGRENEIEVTDIKTGLEMLIADGIADPDRVGVMGWSNGGYLTNCMITAEPDLFAAASSGAGVLDMVIQWGIEDTPGHVVNFVEGLPWEQAHHYQTASPLFKLDQVKTPTLIHVGGNDPRVPPAHSKALYRALKHYLDVPVELVVYPGEPHGLTTHENRLAKMEWDLAWFGKYLLGEETEDSSE